MNDDIIIVGAYPNTTELEIMLKNCITQLKKTNKEVLLVSHYPVKREIQNLVDYFIYDIRNPILTESMLYWYGNKKFFLRTGAFGFASHAFAVLLSIQNAVCFAKKLGKKIFYYFENDCFISDKDLENIDLLQKEVYKKGKRGHFQKDSFGKDNLHNYGVRGRFFMFEVDLFLEAFSILQTPEEYKKNVKGGIALEFYFYQGLSKYFSQLDIQDADYSEKIFPNSSFSLSTYELLHFIDILPEQKSRKPVLTITNSKKGLKEYRIYVLNNNNIISKLEVSVKKGGYYYNILQEVKHIQIFYKENNQWKLIYDKNPDIEVKKKSELEYVIIG